MKTYLKTTLLIGLGEIEEILADDTLTDAGKVARIGGLLDGMARHDSRERLRLLGKTVERANRQMMLLLEGEETNRQDTKGAKEE